MKKKRKAPAFKGLLSTKSYWCHDEEHTEVGTLGTGLGDMNVDDFLRGGFLSETGFAPAEHTTQQKLKEQKKGERAGRCT